MDAKKCDRCGRYYERDGLAVMQKYELYPLCVCKQIDLCDRCMSDLNEFMKPISILKKKEETK